MNNDVYRKLQQRLDLYSLGFPATESGVELTILKRLFSEEDAALFLNLTPSLETAGVVSARLGRDEAEVADQLEAMAAKGLAFRLEKGGTVRYGAIPFVHGVFEFQVGSMDRDLAGLVETYFEEGFRQRMAEQAAGFLRTIPIERSLETTQTVASFEDACEILKKHSLIVVTDCICRRQKSLIDKGCGRISEACFMFGSMGQYYLDKGLGRKIDADEAMVIVQKAQDQGLVTQPATAQNPGGMCNCCGDCCGVLSALNSCPNPADLVFSNHIVSLDAETCIGCGTCIERCQMSALTLNGEELADLNPVRCIGCGLCVTTCPTGSLTLAAKPEASRRVPPETGTGQMIALAKSRGIL